MDDLISRKALMENMRNTITESSDTLDWVNLINSQPTAYDVEKVMEQLKDEIRVIKNNMCVEQSETLQNKLVHRLQQTEKILSIVKSELEE